MPPSSLAGRQAEGPPSRRAGGCPAEPPLLAACTPRHAQLVLIQSRRAGWSRRPPRPPTAPPPLPPGPTACRCAAAPGCCISSVCCQRLLQQEMLSAGTSVKTASRTAAQPCRCPPRPLTFSAPDATAATARWLQGMAAPAAAAPQVAVITTLGCPYCKKAKAALEVRSFQGRSRAGLGRQPTDALASTLHPAPAAAWAAPACFQPLLPCVDGPCRRRAFPMLSTSCRSKWR